MMKTNERIDSLVSWSPEFVPSSLADMHVIPERQVVHKILHAGLDIRLFVYARPESGRVVLMGQDAIVPGRAEMPLFYRWSWYRDLDATVVVINDPTMLLHSGIVAGWGQGNVDCFAVPPLAEAVSQVCRLVNVDPSNALIYGTSAGGFWALMTAAEISSRCVAVEIPQVDLAAYHEHDNMKALFNACYPGYSKTDIVAQFPDRIRVIDRWLSLGRAPSKVVYCQNKADVKHTRTQLNPFLDRLHEVRNALGPHCPEIDVRWYERVGENGRGHVQMEKVDSLGLIRELLDV